MLYERTTFAEDVVENLDIIRDHHDDFMDYFMATWSNIDMYEQNFTEVFEQLLKQGMFMTMFREPFNIKIVHQKVTTQAGVVFIQPTKRRERMNLYPNHWWHEEDANRIFHTYLHELAHIIHDNIVLRWFDPEFQRRNPAHPIPTEDKEEITTWTNYIGTSHGKEFRWIFNKVFKAWSDYADRYELPVPPTNDPMWQGDE